MNLCKRCRKPFQPKPTGLKFRTMSLCCEDCQFRNIMDGLGLPTPPEMLDPHTKDPALTDAEYRKKIASIKET